MFVSQLQPDQATLRRRIVQPQLLGLVIVLRFLDCSCHGYELNGNLRTTTKRIVFLFGDQNQFLETAYAADRNAQVATHLKLFRQLGRDVIGRTGDNDGV